MGIRFQCPSGHKLHVKTFLAGKRGICPHCGAKFTIPEPTEAESAGNGDLHDSKFAVGNGSSSADAFGAPSVMVSLAGDQEGIAGTPTVIDLATFEVPGAAVSPVSPTVHETKSPSPAPVRYIALRERSRRNQVTLAAALLIAVIVLALILIWVLGRNSGPAPAAQAWPRGDFTAMVYSGVTADLYGVGALQ